MSTGVCADRKLACSSFFFPENSLTLVVHVSVMWIQCCSAISMSLQFESSHPFPRAMQMDDGGQTYNNLNCLFSAGLGVLERCAEVQADFADTELQAVTHNLIPVSD